MDESIRISLNMKQTTTGISGSFDILEHLHSVNESHEARQSGVFIFSIGILEIFNIAVSMEDPKHCGLLRLAQLLIAHVSVTWKMWQCTTQDKLGRCAMPYPRYTWKMCNSLPKICDVIWENPSMLQSCIFRNG